MGKRDCSINIVLSGLDRKQAKQFFEEFDGVRKKYTPNGKGFAFHGERTKVAGYLQKWSNK